MIPRERPDFSTDHAAGRSEREECFSRKYRMDFEIFTEYAALLRPIAGARQTGCVMSSTIHLMPL